MIEDELRTLLADRAGTLPDNAGRLPQVRSRIRAARRRRAGGTALGLVVLAAVGLGLTRLPSTEDALPTAIPPGPYFLPNGSPAVQGFSTMPPYRITGPERMFRPMGSVPLRHAVVVRCEQRGTMVVRNLQPGGPSLAVDCVDPVGARFEGIAVVDAEESERLLAQAPASPCCNVEVLPGSAGRWEVALLPALAPDRLEPWSNGDGGPLVDGAAHPDGDTVTFTVPPRSPATGDDYGFALTVDCIEGVQLTLTVPRGTLAVLTCDAEHRLEGGRVGETVSRETLDRLGLGRGEQVTLTVRSTGRETDQWRLYPISY